MLFPLSVTFDLVYKFELAPRTFDFVPANTVCLTALIFTRKNSSGETFLLYNLGI